MLIVFLLSSELGAQELVLEADRVQYDATARTLKATGNVRVRYLDVRLWADEAFADLGRGEILVQGGVILEQAGRRLAADRIRYRLRTREASATQARAVVDGIYYRAEEITLQGNVLQAFDALATLCDPASPLFRVIARRIALVPAQRLVAEDASLWMGNIRLLGLGRLEVPLRERPFEQFAKSLPRPEAGYDAIGGLWAALRYPYRAGDLSGEAYLRYSALLGLEGRNRLWYPMWSLELVTGALRDEENRPYDALELRYAPPPGRLPFLAATMATTLLAGAYRERVTDAQSPKLEGAMSLTWDPLSLSPQTTLAFSASLRASLYRDRSLIVPAVNLGLTHRLDARSAVTGSYTRTDLVGSSPFLFDLPDRTEAVSVGYAYAGPGFGFAAGVAYDFVPRHLKLSGSASADLLDNWRLGFSAVYNATRSGFEDLDLIVGTRCDCLSVSLTYRMVRREIFLNFTLTPSPALRIALPEPPE
ncbi:MAG: hypothetical protein QN140_04320 [Armatimonadota bacterium]|nr:hypothetical protein [Armatimonadota bacterium]MDR7438390.1 hypothetical protein [Armatimonadota bacterium]MDR7563344.1 hypothetical protein [Armatimonadota bacterium]